MDQVEVVQIFRDHLDSAFVDWLTFEVEREYVTVIVESPHPDRSCLGHRFELVTNGAEAFSVIVDDKYFLLEFEYVPEEQVRLVSHLAEIANVVLRGGGTTVTKRGLFGRRVTILPVRVGAQTYELRPGKRSFGFNISR